MRTHISKHFKSLTVLTALVFAAGISAEARITRVAKRWNMLEVYGGYSTAVGSYNRVGVIDFVDSRGFLADVDADKVYDPTYHFGLSYGQLRGGHLFYAVGFRYTKVETEDTFFVDPSIAYSFVPLQSKLHQYDIQFDLNFMPANISVSPISPYAGIGLRGGITSQSAKGYESENWVTVVAGLNFGTDFKLWHGGDDRGFVTLSSVNSIDLLASDRRPRYLNVGASLKYFFRP
ncbi:MAG TPA: hypothetical protein VN285_06300 [Candidatus Deferrimicrobium sp.]|nr:hypothetical protein [Candidatus Deferrimicrobium sp.]